jgi:predicted regulator of Ras-like GTPase activity (Roadblock/LC7/MglB family)
MLTVINPRLDVPLSAPVSNRDQNVTASNDVIGAAIFDLNGLPKEYFTTRESADVSWVQTIFQALGLQSLLLSSLQLEGFRYIVVQGREYRAIVTKQKSRYTAILVRRTTEAVAETLVKWAQDFEPASLRADPRFNVV